MTSSQKKAEAKFAARVFSDYLIAQRGRIPILPQIEDVSERVVRVLGGNPGEMQLQGTNTYLVGTGKSRILIDTGQGFSIWIESLVEYLETHGLDIACVLLTHWHSDHTGGITDLIARYPRLASRIHKNQPDRLQVSIEDGQTFQVEGATVRAIFTPGHAVDHMCFVLEEEHSMFTGDNVLGHGFTVIEDLSTYLNSLRYMADRRCLAGYPGHGAKIDDLKSKIKLYIQREDLRVAQVYATLAKPALPSKGDQDRRLSFNSRELVTFLYGDVSESLFRLALEPCMNLCLWKLAEDGKVAFQVQESSRRWYARAGAHAETVR